MYRWLAGNFMPAECHQTVVASAKLGTLKQENPSMDIFYVLVAECV
jgi:hypothetical protein